MWIWLVLLFLVRLIYVIKHPIRHVMRKSKRISLCIVLGSGGHTTEMFRILSQTNTDKFYPRHYIIASTDRFSASKVHEFESMYPEKLTDSYEKLDADNIINKHTRFQSHYIPRAREVGQSWISSFFTTLHALCHSVHLFYTIYPDMLICNGPGTCIPLCLIAFIFRVLTCQLTLVILR
jgi:beta-1,4-N-acetylglucosaminyltransferase